MELAVEDFLPVRAEGLDEDVLDGLVVLVPSVQLAAALRLAQLDPVGGAIAGALEARGSAERLDMKDAMPPQGRNQIMSQSRRPALASEREVAATLGESAGAIESLRRE